MPEPSLSVLTLGILRPSREAQETEFQGAHRADTTRVSLPLICPSPEAGPASISKAAVGEAASTHPRWAANYLTLKRNLGWSRCSYPPKCPQRNPARPLARNLSSTLVALMRLIAPAEQCLPPVAGHGPLNRNMTQRICPERPYPEPPCPGTLCQKPA